MREIVTVMQQLNGTRKLGMFLLANLGQAAHYSGGPVHVLVVLYYSCVNSTSESAQAVYDSVYDSVMSRGKSRSSEKNFLCQLEQNVPSGRKRGAIKLVFG